MCVASRKGQNDKSITARDQRNNDCTGPRRKWEGQVQEEQIECEVQQEWEVVWMNKWTPQVVWSCVVASDYFPIQLVAKLVKHMTPRFVRFLCFFLREESPKMKTNTGAWSPGALVDWPAATRRGG